MLGKTKKLCFLLWTNFQSLKSFRLKIIFKIINFLLTLFLLLLYNILFFLNNNFQVF